MNRCDSKFGILIVGFNRPDFLIERIEELKDLNLSHVEIYVSLDSPRRGNSSDLASHIEILERLDTLLGHIKFHLFIEEINRGCDKHITLGISRVLHDCVGVLVIEDDIFIPCEQIKAILEFAAANYKEMQTEPIITMSGLSNNQLLKLNRWRRSPYFTAWGYFLFENFWNKHVQLLEFDEKTIQRLLNRSYVWTSMSKRKKLLWSERFSRKNYDYLIQRSLFALDTNVYAPVFRMANNLGFGDARAAHTRFSAPSYLRRYIASQKRASTPIKVRSSVVNEVLERLDSNTWAGDGWFSKRGRSVGIRTFLKHLSDYHKRSRNA